MKSIAKWAQFAVILAFVFARPATAEVVYTPVNAGIPANGSYPLDLNHDGTPDFLLQSSVGQLWCQFGDGAYWKLTVQTLQSSGGIVSTDQNAAALPPGVPIGSNQVFAAGRFLMTYFSYGACGNTIGGNWFNLPNRYLGLEFQILGRSGMETHYGWAKVTDVAYLDRHGNLQTSTFISGFAYETVPGRALLTGQTSGQ